MNARRIIGLVLLLIATTFLALAVVTIGSLLWLGLPSTTTLGRTLAFALGGLILGLGAYRLASGTWVGSLQVPHRAVALGGLLFLGYVAKSILFKMPRPHPPPMLMSVIAGLALLSWCLAARRKRTWPINRHSTH
jgi:hypothetical protein